jgi:hypothetical protein
LIIDFQSLISSCVGDAAHHLNTLATSDATASAVTLNLVISEFHVALATRFLNTFNAWILVFHNQSIVSINVFTCHTVVLTEMMFCDLAHAVRSFINLCLAGYFLASKLGFTSAAADIILE